MLITLFTELLGVVIQVLIRNTYLNSYPWEWKKYTNHFPILVQVLIIMV